MKKKNLWEGLGERKGETWIYTEINIVQLPRLSKSDRKFKLMSRAYESIENYLKKSKLNKL